MLTDDFDQPNTAPGNCPECGQPANIWEAVSQQWECVYCNWRGRNPKRPAPVDDSHLAEVCF